MLSTNTDTAQAAREPPSRPVKPQTFSSAELFGDGSTLRVNQDCLDIIVEFAVATTEELRRVRLLAVPFARAVVNMLSYSLCRGQPTESTTGTQSHADGASLTRRGIDSVRFQLPKATGEQVMRHVLGIAGHVITRFDADSFRYFSLAYHEAENSHARLRDALQRMPALTEANIRVALGQGGPDVSTWIATLLNLPTATKLSLPGASPRLLDAVAAAMPQLEEVQLPYATSDIQLADNADPSPPPSSLNPNLARLSLETVVPDLTMEFVRRFAMTTTLASVSLPFRELDLTDTTLLTVLNGPSIRHLCTVEDTGWHSPLPLGLSVDTLRRLQTLHGFVVPRGALPELRSLQKIGLRLPVDVTDAATDVHELPLVTTYAAELAKACGASLTGLDLDVDQPNAPDIAQAFTDGYVAAFRDGSTRCPLQSFVLLDAPDPQGDWLALLKRLRPVPLRVFHPDRFPELQELGVMSAPWDAAGFADEPCLGASPAPGAWLTRLNINAPATLEMLTAIGRVAGASLQSLRIQMDRHDSSHIVMDAAPVLEAHFPALEELYALQLCVRGWRASQHKLLRRVFVAIHANALADFMAQVAQCPLIEYVCVRDATTAGVNTFDASDQQPPYRNVLAPFRTHRCPRLMAVDGVCGCDSPRMGDEFVPRLHGCGWELASFAL